jgi:hypothetical protein
MAGSWEISHSSNTFLHRRINTFTVLHCDNVYFFTEKVRKGKPLLRGYLRLAKMLTAP